MIFRCFIFMLTVLVANDSTDVSVLTHYVRGGYSMDKNLEGMHLYYRLNVRSSTAFRDLRIFGYSFAEDAYVYLRYKTSFKYKPEGKLYQFTTLSYQKNTRANLDLRFHFNQGFGYFIHEYTKGRLHTELGHAYDMSDYLNDTRKTSYVKAGLFWDHSLANLKSKSDIEFFKQISDVVETDQSRFQLFTEIAYLFYPPFSIQMGYEKDYYLKTDFHPQSFYLSLGWAG